MTDYSDRDFALSEVLNNPAVRGLPDEPDTAHLGAQLDVMAGSLAGTTVYRPYYVAARYLEQKRSQQSIKVGGGATFTNLETPIASLYRQQAALDEALGLTIPPGLESEDPNCHVCSKAFAKLRRPSFSIAPTLRP